jgi:hypothetical protein
MKDDWRGGKVKAGCGNCKKPEGAGGSFTDFGVNRRCAACVSHRAKHNGEERPERLYIKDKWRK